MTTTALNIITGAAQLIGAVFKSEALSSDDAADGLVLLNDLLDSWSNDDLTTYAMTLENFTLTGAASYTIGSGGTFNTSRPINIVDAVVRVGTVDYPLECITQEQYQTGIPVKSISGTIPQMLVYDNGYPLGLIKIYTVPGSGTLYLQSNKPLANLSALTATVDLPPGWKRALKNNLAMEMAPQYGVDVPQMVIRNAAQSLGALRRATSINNAMPPLPSNLRSWNIYSGPT